MAAKKTLIDYVVLEIDVKEVSQLIEEGYQVLYEREHGEFLEGTISGLGGI